MVNEIGHKCNNELFWWYCWWELTLIIGLKHKSDNESDMIIGNIIVGIVDKIGYVVNFGIWSCCTIWSWYVLIICLGCVWLWSNYDCVGEW